jgi:hypothetical protein
MPNIDKLLGKLWTWFVIAVIVLAIVDISACTVRNFAGQTTANEDYLQIDDDKARELLDQFVIL